MKEKQFVAIMDFIVDAIKERGYGPYDQLIGYVIEKEPLYITRHKHARHLIQMLDFEQVKQYVQAMKH